MGDPATERARTELVALDAEDFTGGANAVAYTGDDLITTGDVVTVTGDFSVTDPDNGEAEGGSRAPSYAILSGEGSDPNVATVSAATTGTGSNVTYTVTNNSVTWGTIAPQHRHRRMDLHR